MAILKMELEYNFLDKSFINSILIPSEEEAGLFPEEAFGTWKYHRTTQVVFCRWLYWDSLI